jgi:hypothetical protein
MGTGSEPGTTGDRPIDAVRQRYAVMGPSDLLPMPDDDERLLLESTASTAVASARDETRRPRARVQLLQGAAEAYALLGDVAKAIELLTLADQILPTVMVRKRRAELSKEINAAEHSGEPAGQPPLASAPRRRRWGLPR